MAVSRPNARAILAGKIARKESFTADDIISAIDIYNNDVRGLVRDINTENDSLNLITGKLTAAIGAKATAVGPAKAFLADADKIKQDLLKLKAPDLVDPVPTTAQLSNSDDRDHMQTLIVERMGRLQLVNNVIADTSTTGIPSKIVDLGDRLPDLITEINNATIDKYNDTFDLTEKMYKDAHTLFQTIKSGDAGIANNDPIKSLFRIEFIRDAAEPLRERRTFLRSLKNIDDPADPADRKKFEAEEARQSTQSLVGKLNAATTVLKAAIAAEKDKRIKELTTLTNAALNEFTSQLGARSSRTNPTIAVDEIVAATTAEQTLFKKGKELFGAALTKLDKDGSSLDEITKAGAAVQLLINDLEVKTNIATSAYDTAYALVATQKDAEDLVVKLRTNCGPSLTLAQALITDTNKNFNKIANGSKLKTELAAAKDNLDKNLNSMDVDFSAADKRKEFVEYAPLSVTNGLSELDRAIKTVHKAIEDQFNKTRDDAIDQINKSSELNACVALNRDIAAAAPGGLLDPVLLNLPSVQSANNDLITAYDELEKARVALLALKSPTNPADYLTALDNLEAKIATQTIADKLDALNSALSAFSDTYNKASTTKTMLDDNKQKLQAKIYAVINDKEIIRVNDELAKDPKLVAKHPNIAFRLNDLRDILKIDAAGKNNIDKSPDQATLDALNTTADNAIDLLKKAILTARLDVDKHIVDNVKKRFDSYKEQVKRFQGVLDITVDQVATSAAKYKDTLAEMNRVKDHLELYAEQMKIDKNRSKEHEALAELKKLQEAIDFLEKPKAGFVGVRHFSHSSLFVKGTDKATFETALKDAGDQLLKDAGYTPAGASSSLILSSAPKSNVTDRFTSGFGGLNVAKEFEGRVNLTVTKGHTSKDKEIVSVDTQRIDAKGVRTYEMNFQSIDTSTHRRTTPFNWNPTGKTSYNQVNDRLSLHTLKGVLNYMVTEKDLKLKTEMIDEMLLCVITGKDHPGLKKLAQNTPVFINQGDSAVAKAVALACMRLGAKWTDSRGPGAKTIHVGQEEYDTYAHHIQKNRDFFLADIGSVTTTKQHAAQLTTDTTPKRKP